MSHASIKRIKVMDSILVNRRIPGYIRKDIREIGLL